MMARGMEWVLGKRVYRLTAAIKWGIEDGIKYGLQKWAQPEFKVIRLEPIGKSRGNVLFSYYIEPFLGSYGSLLDSSDPCYYHPGYWQCTRMVQVFREFGYAIDVIWWMNDRFIPKKRYACFVDVRHNMERLAPLLNRDCIKIFHIDSAHLLFHNAAEARRLLDLRNRRRITLRERRYERLNFGIEYADCATIFGNQFTLGTFRYANKPLFPVPVSSNTLYPWTEEKNVEACRKQFLWFGSGGMVHKGLDLVLEAFRDMPDYQLTVCGPVQQEKDFETEYYKELYETSNIHTVGWVDVQSPSFIEILKKSVGMIYPSCSEGQCTGVVTCMHAGLIPIISSQTGVDVDDFGVVLRTCSIEEIKNAVQRVAEMPADKLEVTSRKAWEYARTNHTREKFVSEYRNAIECILAGGDKRNRNL